MTTVTQCYTPIKGRILRVTALDVCGRPICGEDSAVVYMRGFTQVAQSAQYDTGAEQFVRNADADVCVNEKDPDVLKRLQLTIDFCVVDPGLVVTAVSPSRLLTSGAVGTGFALAEGASLLHFSLEVWQRVSGAGACAPGGEPQYVYNAWPHLVNGHIGDYNIQNDPSTLQIVAETKAVHPDWHLGEPWLGIGAIEPVPDHWLQNLTTTAPPEMPEECGLLELVCEDGEGGEG